MFRELLLSLLQKPHAAAIPGTCFTFNQYWKILTPNADEEWSALETIQCSNNSSFYWLNRTYPISDASSPYYESDWADHIKDDTEVNNRLEIQLRFNCPCGQRVTGFNAYESDSYVQHVDVVWTFDHPTITDLIATITGIGGATKNEITFTDTGGAIADMLQRGDYYKLRAPI